MSFGTQITEITASNRATQDIITCVIDSNYSCIENILSTYYNCTEKSIKSQLKSNWNGPWRTQLNRTTLSMWPSRLKQRDVGVAVFDSLPDDANNQTGQSKQSDVRPGWQYSRPLALSVRKTPRTASDSEPQTSLMTALKSILAMWNVDGPQCFILNQDCKDKSCFRVPVHSVRTGTFRAGIRFRVSLWVQFWNSYNIHL